MDATTENIDQMVSMGFDRDLSRRALSQSGGNVGQAIENILAGQVSDSASALLNDTASNATGSATSGISGPNRIIGAEISQYSIPGGRSACTAIALKTVSMILQEFSTKSDEPCDFITQAKLASFVMDGVELYNRLRTNSGIENPNIEHSSAEELISMIPDKLGLNLIGGVRQGMLTKKGIDGGPFGLDQILKGCRLEGDNEKWMGIVITKTPETICVFLPPLKNDQSHEYIIVDSHPRPPQEGCHAVFHSSIEGVLESLGSVFVAVDLGNDVPEMMAAMYNSFDIYAFQT